MKKICFATNNANKLREIQQILGDEYTLVSLAEIGCHEELPENQDTLEGNSLEKAEYVSKKFGISVFADDTGLEVRALDGDPGVHSAHYAGTRDASENMKKLLTELGDNADRSARFRTVITLIDDGAVHQFEGFVEGSITREVRGEGGFGYDPIFIPSGRQETFSEMSAEDKNQISHRKRAIEKLVDFLKQHS